MKIHNHNPDLVIDIHIDLNPLANFLKQVVSTFSEIAEVAQCPDAANHLHYERLMASWPDALITDECAMLKIKHYHICKTRIITESVLTK